MITRYLIQSSILRCLRYNPFKPLCTTHTPRITEQCYHHTVELRQRICTSHIQAIIGRSGQLR
jgi:hypothetical protein